MEGEREEVALVLGEGDTLGDLEGVVLTEGEKVGETPVGVELRDTLGDLEEDPVPLGVTVVSGERDRDAPPLEEGEALAEADDVWEAFRVMDILGELLAVALTEGDLLGLGLGEGLPEEDEPPVEDINGEVVEELLGDLVVEALALTDREARAEAVEDRLTLALPEPLGEKE